MGSELAIRRRFPGLAALPRTPFLDAPTPVEPLPLAGVAEGLLWVKRDDRSCPIYGGNKPRKLEFVIGRALERRSRRLVTTGGLGTHHGLATALLGRTRDLDTSVVLVHQPVTQHVRVQLRALAASGAELVYAGGVGGAAFHTARVLARSALRGERPTLVPTGGTSGLSGVGFASAAIELADQIDAGAAPRPAEIFVPVGSGGTISGLVLGLRLAELEVPVRGVLVTDILPPSPARLARLARATLACLRRADAAVPAVPISEADFALDAAQLGAGYGAPTEAAHAAIERAAGAGLALEAVYTAKCLAAILERTECGHAPGPLLFWNTYSSIPLPETSPEAEARLPAALRALLEGPLDA